MGAQRRTIFVRRRAAESDLLLMLLSRRAASVSLVADSLDERPETELSGETGDLDFRLETATSPVDADSGFVEAVLRQATPLLG